MLLMKTRFFRHELKAVRTITESRIIIYSYSKQLFVFTFLTADVRLLFEFKIRKKQKTGRYLFLYFAKTHSSLPKILLNNLKTTQHSREHRSLQRSYNIKSARNLTLSKNELIHFVKVFFWMSSRSSCSDLMRLCSNLRASSLCVILLCSWRLAAAPR